MIRELIDDDSLPKVVECASCAGLGYYDVGDCEDGVTDVCPECDGEGVIEL
jgi:DnaJ-class molecular chaperone